MKTIFHVPTAAALCCLLLVTMTMATSAAEAEFFETLPNGDRPTEVSGNTEWETNFAGVAQQPAGSLSGRLVFTSGGHGWTWSKDGWFTQRNVVQEMNEDYGNLDQMNFFVPYAFNAGATVVAFRPIGYQTNEVVLDNESQSVKFSGKWFQSSSPVFFGESGTVPYRFAVLSPKETATATYTPRIRVAGFYPVYTWVRHGPDRTSQLYRILHTGGETHIRIPHHMVGNGWVYLGTYYFDAGSNRAKGSVIVSNLQPSPGFGSVAVADAIRFGNGMGDVIPSEGAALSSYPREEEASRYWVQRSFGQGQSDFLSNASNAHQPGNVGAPNRMAHEMNRESEGDPFKRIFLSFHSNAGGGRGTLGLWNDPKLFPGTKTPNQERWAELIGREVNDTLHSLSNRLEVPWFHRTRLTYARNDYAFGEISDRYIDGEFDATILEVAFHDSEPDAKLLRDPKVRDITARSSYRAMVRYMNEFDGVPLQFLPEPPQNVRAIASANGITVTWNAPDADTTNAPQAYLVYRSKNGYGFGDPLRIPGETTSATFAASPKAVVYFRFTAVNDAGESMPSTIVGALPAKQTGKVLFVNGFTEIDRLNNPRQTIEATNYVPPSAFGKMDRVIPRLNNAFDYVVQHGNALAENKTAFDACQRDAISRGEIKLDSYAAVIWAAGRQRTNLLDAAEQKALSAYLKNGGCVFISGAHPGLSSSFSLSPNPLKRELQPFAVGPARQSIFRGNSPLTFGEGRDQSYFIADTSALVPSTVAAEEALWFFDGSASAAAIQYEDVASGGKMVAFGFPFETISSARLREEYLSDVLNFFGINQR